MSIGPIVSLGSSYLQSLLGSSSSTSGTTGSSDSSSTTRKDGPQLSPFAQLLSTLQQLQQSDPGKYQQLTQQIASNLQKAAATAQSNGNTSAADTLNQLATDFSNASQSGQLPSIKDLAQAMHGHHHGHHQWLTEQASPAEIVSNALSDTGITGSGN